MQTKMRPFSDSIPLSYSIGTLPLTRILRSELNTLEPEIPQSFNPEAVTRKPVPGRTPVLRALIARLSVTESLLRNWFCSAKHVAGKIQF